MQYKNLAKMVKSDSSIGADYVALPETLMRRLLGAAIRQKGEFDDDLSRNLFRYSQCRS